MKKTVKKPVELEKALQNPLHGVYIDALKIKHDEKTLEQSLGLSEEEYRNIQKMVSSLSMEFILDPDIDKMSKMIEHAFFKYDINTFHPSIAFLIGLLTGITIEKFKSFLEG